MATTSEDLGFNTWICGRHFTWLPKDPGKALAKCIYSISMSPQNLNNFRIFKNLTSVRYSMLTCTSILGRLQQKGCGFKASLGYIASLSPAWATEWDLVLKNTKQK
jgi:hypothetical protein